MSVSDAMSAIGALLVMPLCGLVAWAVGKIIACVQNRKEEVEILREKLKEVIRERDAWQDEAERSNKLLRAATERGDRLAAMGQGLAEDLAALKAYNSEEVEERLRKIRELRAEEERKMTLERLKQAVQFSVAMSMLTGGYGSPASACCSLEDQQRMWGR